MNIQQSVPDALDPADPDYGSHILSLRRSRRLHTVVENKLKELLRLVAPTFYPISEVQGLAGGRNDLMLFNFDGRTVVVEIFATASQVSRDLLILHKTQADLKIAVLIDETVDPNVVERFLRQNPDEPYPWIYIGELFANPPTDCYLKLREIILGEESAKLRRLLRQEYSTEGFLIWCRQQGINVFLESDVKAHQISYAQVFVTLVLSKCTKLGVSRKALVDLGRWLSETNTLDWVFLKISMGFNMFLYTNLLDHFEAASDTELLDWIRGGHLFSDARIILSLNAVAYELEDQFLRSDELRINPNRDISITVAASQLFVTSEGIEVTLGLPRDLKSIILYPHPTSKLDPDQYRDLIEVVATPPLRTASSTE